jgi:protein YIPF5/7
MADSDMAGPLVFCLALGFFLLLTGKLHFGYIYGFGMLGCGSLYLLVNLLADQGASLDLSRTFSVMGYCLLPIVMLSALSVLIDLKGTVGAVLGVSAIAWCTFAAARIFEAALGLSQHRWLIAYPALLFYACFALITIF